MEQEIGESRRNTDNSTVVIRKVERVPLVPAEGRIRYDISGDLTLVSACLRGWCAFVCLAILTPLSLSSLVLRFELMAAVFRKRDGRKRRLRYYCDVNSVLETLKDS